MPGYAECHPCNLCGRCGKRPPDERPGACPACGHVNGPGAGVCEVCGAPLVAIAGSKSHIYYGPGGPWPPDT